MHSLLDISKWTTEYIEALPPGEFDWLEFKASPWFSRETECLDQLSKYASAYANYEGGYLVVGATQHSGKCPVVDGGVPLPDRGDLKSWLEDKVPHLADPPLSQLKVALIEHGPSNPGISPGHAVIILHIPDSAMAPHQARDRKFYTRLGSKLSPLPTRAILDIAQRIRHPMLRAEAKFNLEKPDDCNLLVRIKNDSDVLVRHVGVMIRFPVYFRGMPTSFANSRLDTGEDGRTDWMLWFSNNGGTPLFPHASVQQTFDLRLGGRFDPPPKESLPDIRIRIYADSMPFAEFSIPIEDAVNGVSDLMQRLVFKRSK